jgi:hypothetical protein
MKRILCFGLIILLTGVWGCSAPEDSQSAEATSVPVAESSEESVDATSGPDVIVFNDDVLENSIREQIGRRTAISPLRMRRR